MTTKDEALTLALGALETERDNYRTWGDEDGAPDYIHDAITAIKQAQDVALINEGDMPQAITPETGNAATPLASAITAGNGQAPYSLDADPQGIRARVVSAVIGAMAYGARGVNKPPEGHWLNEVWDIARAEAVQQAQGQAIYLGWVPDTESWETCGEKDYGDLPDGERWLLYTHPAPKQAEPAWQPIESAPNGTMVLFANMSPRIQASEWCFVAWMADGKLCGHRMDKPTHWMHLPTPPEAE